MACFAFAACLHPAGNNQVQLVDVNNADSLVKGTIQNGQRIGVWDELDKKKGIRVRSFYGYRKDTFEVQAAHYYLKDTPVLSLYYRYTFIKDLDVKKPDLVAAVLPFLDNFLGQELFYTNCGDCHFYVPGVRNRALASLVERMYKDGTLVDLIVSGRRAKGSDSVSLQHPSMPYLDTTEISAIVKFVTVIDTSVAY